jgi:acetyltransferase
MIVLSQNKGTKNKYDFSKSLIFHSKILHMHMSSRSLIEKNESVSYCRGLANFFEPRHVAVIGATERPNSVGYTLLSNLFHAWNKNHFDIYPVNPNRETCCGLRCYPSIEVAPPVDLAVVVTPLKAILSVMESCCKAKVGGMIIITAGFKETGHDGLVLEQKILGLAQQHGVRIIGPNCLGIMSPHWGLNASFSSSDTFSGGIAFVSQSGAMCTAILDWSREKNVGFSAFASIGSMVDVDWGDFIEYFDKDVNTHTIILYVETIGRTREFLSAARRTSKKIFILKAGQSESAAQAAISHTGSLAGSHKAFVAAMKRAGLCVINSISELLDVALLVGKQKYPQGPRLLIVTNAGGPGVLATDAAALSGAEIVSLEPNIVQELNKILPAPWSRNNPVDILGDASANLYRKTLEILFKYDFYDGILIILSPQSVTDATGTAKQVLLAYENAQKNHFNKIILCSWMGGSAVKEGADILNDGGIPSFNCPDDASRIYSLLYKAQAEKNKTVCLETYISKPKDALIQVSQLIRNVKQQKRTILTEDESKALLSCYGIQVAQTVLCMTAEECVQYAKKINHRPLVAKIHSNTLTHKSDVGGVILNLYTDKEIQNAFHTIQNNIKPYGSHHFQGITLQPMFDIANGYELILGSNYDSQIGPLLLLGTGGVMVEIYNDTILDLPPVGLQRAKELITSTCIGKIFNTTSGKRFKRVDENQVYRTIVLFSMLVSDTYKQIKEIDINPLYVAQDSVVALDCRVVLHDDTLDSSLQLTTGLSSYPNDYDCITDSLVINLVTSQNLQSVKELCHSALITNLHDFHGTQFDFSSIWRSVELNDYVSSLAFCISIVQSSSKEPVALTILQKVAGTRDTARAVMICLSNKLTSNVLNESLEHILNISILEKIDHLFITIPPTSHDKYKVTASTLQQMVNTHNTTVLSENPLTLLSEHNAQSYKRF